MRTVLSCCTCHLVAPRSLGYEVETKDHMMDILVVAILPLSTNKNKQRKRDRQTQRSPAQSVEQHAHPLLVRENCESRYECDTFAPARAQCHDHP